MLKRDKVLHLIVGFGISFSVASFFLVLFKYPLMEAIVCGAVTACLAGIWKDAVHDLMQKKGQFEWLDILYTAIGGVIGSLAIFVIAKGV